MISFVAKLLLATLVFNTASVIAAPVRRAVVPRSDAPAPAPAPEPVGPVGLSTRNVVDVRGTHVSSTNSRRTMSRRQARLVEREPELEQPSLDARNTPVDAVLEQPSASQKRRRYPRRVYFEYYEKRSPDSAGGTDGNPSKPSATPPLPPVNNGMDSRMRIGIVIPPHVPSMPGSISPDTGASTGTPTGTGATPPAEPTSGGSTGIPTTTDSNGPNSPDTGATSVPTPTDATDASKPDASSPSAASPTPTDASGQTLPGRRAGPVAQLNVKLEQTPDPAPPTTDAKPDTLCAAKLKIPSDTEPKVETTPAPVPPPAPPSDINPTPTVPPPTPPSDVTPKTPTPVYSQASGMLTTALPPAPPPPPALNLPIYAPTPPPGPWQSYMPKHPGLYKPTPTGMVYVGPNSDNDLSEIAADIGGYRKRGSVIGDRQLAYSGPVYASHMRR